MTLMKLLKDTNNTTKWFIDINDNVHVKMRNNRSARKVIKINVAR